MASRQWENSDARRTRATRVALRVEMLPPASEGSRVPQSVAPFKLRMVSISLSYWRRRTDRQSSERDDTWPRQLPCSNLNESHIFLL